MDCFVAYAPRNDGSLSDTAISGYCRFCPLGAAAAAGGLGGAAAGLGGGAAASAAGAALLLPPKITRLGLRSKLFTARLMSPSVRRPSDINAPERLSKSSASSRID